MLTHFVNEPITDFSKEENRKAMKSAIASVEAELGAKYPLIIGGEPVMTDKTFQSLNPSNPDEIVGEFSGGTRELLEKVMSIAWDAGKKWGFMPPEERAGILLRAAAIMREKRFEMDAWLILETGKNWIEADADVAEAIDFLEFYAREMIRYGGPQPLTPHQAENAELRYIPLGIGVVIPPWNFPMAILAGMASASVVTGNTVILKPSSDSPGIGYKFCEIMTDAGLPPGVLNFFPGRGSVIGDPIVAHPKTRFIAFTGSKEVGLHINELAATTSPGQIWIKRVVAEMGGKDCIVVDSETDLDLAAPAIVASAFGYQGQKCSACSRLIVVKDVYDRLLEMIVDLAGKITVGPAKEDPGMGPVINASAEKTILEYIDIGQKEGKLVLGGEKDQGNGFFVRPTIFADVDSKSRISQEEIFGPVLAVTKADSFEEALEMANNTEYGLTGALFSRNREKIRRAKDIFHVGNLYINRKCTGALVGVHPFGGFNMSGTDSKAGGRDYLFLFTQPKSISERYR
jgi:1-pyrroline-5-carboxylate dehydrogenase